MIAFENYSEKEPLLLLLDFCPDTKANVLEEELTKELKENPKKQFNNLLARFVPRSLALKLCEALALPEEKISAELSKKDFHRTLELLKNCPIQLIGRAAGEEFVTAGGVDTDEVDPRSMESKICPDLYFAGEILNVDGFTGGFNLQAAWATGHLAGVSAAELKA
ncbi:NAD(P)/FAD-dependent oxidoreductase [Candidatus Peregrinibacteria bacterium]|nr:MAG: NAD(P)/FAD-dependent oxidoreductase [Candidatus Peregrinibacteria bacterium]